MRMPRLPRWLYGGAACISLVVTALCIEQNLAFWLVLLNASCFALNLDAALWYE